ncbi:hypothetical protein MTR_1g085670 [Medicago truncatula]|uniref:Uncharacterized protein n=1 Tax=Medicago truncatula TaxID=3880 RepID=A0A072VMD4_MEDTR|nr:hypothetical protein MTR_1g085670 [Medicago truncatula]
MCFSEKQRKWVMGCIGSISTSMLVKGSLREEFRLSRKLRQRDSLSPFLFLTVIRLVQSFKLRFFFFNLQSDALIFDEKIWANVRPIKVNLILFDDFGSQGYLFDDFGSQGNPNLTM